MVRKWVVMLGGFQASGRFDSKEDAENKADELTKISGKKWEVKEIWVRRKQ